MVKRALVVGINDYRNWHSVGYPDLSGCRRDAAAFAAILPHSFGFSEGNVTLCEDSEATRAAILGGLTRLIAQSGPGDVLCFYYAGHGGRWPQNGLLQPSQLYYETIVPYDGANEISDWEITNLAQSLEPSRINFTIVLDSCHSGGVFDPPGGAAGRARTARWPQPRVDNFVNSCRTILPLICLPFASDLNGNISNVQRNGGATMTIDESKNFSDQAKATLLAACRYDQTAGEDADHGFFTKAILNTVNQSGFQMDHNRLISNLCQAITAFTNTQVPQLLGRPVRLQENFLEGWNYSI